MILPSNKLLCEVLNLDNWKESSMILPSNKLLCEVLNLDNWKESSIVIDKKKNKITYNGIVSSPSNTFHLANKINFYEFMFKCKEWAHKKGFFLCTGISTQSFDAIDSEFLFYLFDSNTNITHFHEFQDEKDEFSFIVKACEFILKETE